MADIRTLWEEYKEKHHEAVEYKEFLEQHKEELLLLCAVQSDILNSYAKELLNENTTNDTKKLLQAYEAIKTHLRLFLRNQNCSSKETKVFSFRSCTQYAIDDIKDRTCSLVHPSLFNDPIDPLIQNWLQAKVAQRNVSYAQQTYYSLYLRAISHLRMRCFVTAQNDDIKNVNPLMWAHYAKSHTGFCVKYRLNSSVLKEDNNDNCSIDYRPILYRMPKDLNRIGLNEALFAKKAIWRYEKEIRFVAYDTNLPDINTVKLINNMVAEELYIGCRCLEEDVNKLVEATRGTTIPIFKMTVNESNPTQFIYKRIL